MKSKLTIAGLVVVAFLALTAFLPFSRRVFLCYAINPYRVVSNYTVSIPSGGQKQFQAEIMQFFKNNDLMISSGRMLIGEVGNTSNTYFDLQSLGCDGTVFVWSGNDLHPNVFNVVFHESTLFGPKRAETLSQTFVAQFAKRYPISNDKYWNQNTKQ